MFRGATLILEMLCSMHLNRRVEFKPLKCWLCLVPSVEGIQAERCLRLILGSMESLLAFYCWYEIKDSALPRAC